MVTSPDVVEIWEAIFTFLFFPILVALAYAADRGYFDTAKISPVSSARHPEGHQADGPDPKVLAKYLEGAAGPKHRPEDVVAFFSDVNGKINTKYALLESDKAVTLHVMRSPAEGPMTIKWATRDGTAKGSEVGGTGDYEACSAELTFADKENFKTIVIKVFDDNETEDDEVFYVDLLEVAHGGKAYAPGPSATRRRRARSSATTSSSTVPCCGKDFGGTVGFEREGTFVFENTEVEKFIEIPVINTNRYEGESEFTIALKNFARAVERAKFGKHTELKVVIVADTETKDMIDNVQKYLESNDASYNVGSAWGQQFSDALKVGGGDATTTSRRPPATGSCTSSRCPGRSPSPSCRRRPTAAAGSASTSALAFAGIVTAFIGDLAALMGCCLGLKDTVTAITFVALGTSLPDALASKAGRSTTTRDAAVGNVTGSNSVNVFLGLGLPWSIAAIYWSGGFAGGSAEKQWRIKYGGKVDGVKKRGTKGPDGSRNIGFTEDVAFIVPAGNLGLSVGVFVFCACRVPRPGRTGSSGSAQVVLSTCSAADAAFARTPSGLPFFDVLLSDCHLDSQKRGRFFKRARRARVVLAERRAANPSAGRRSLLGALTVARVREKLKSAKAWAPFHHAYYSEADQMHVGFLIDREAPVERTKPLTRCFFFFFSLGAKVQLTNFESSPTSVSQTLGQGRVSSPRAAASSS
ncbi:calcium:sodium antiporter [Aureococcus anophagefferens]|uniref:Calcium:sodium antiporter n=1 Tax=Aureococcus anophagefferens TaxID=44056 RepID=A0ABR1GFI4_AURAN